MGLLPFHGPSGAIPGVFSVTTPSPVGVTALEDFVIRVRDPGRDEREAGRFGGGTEGGSMGDPEGRL